MATGRAPRQKPLAHAKEQGHADGRRQGERAPIRAIPDLGRRARAVRGATHGQARVAHRAEEAPDGPAAPGQRAGARRRISRALRPHRAWRAKQESRLPAWRGTSGARFEAWSIPAKAVANRRRGRREKRALSAKTAVWPALQPEARRSTRRGARAATPLGAPQPYRKAPPTAGASRRANGSYRRSPNRSTRAT